MKRDVKHLILMRHAEADWGLNDFDRPLTKRGHQQAAQAGAWLAERGYIPEQIMSSAALRTRQTTTWVSDALGEKGPTAHLDEGLYEVGASRIIARINGVSENVRSVLVVSHLPGIQDAAIQLTRTWPWRCFTGSPRRLWQCLRCLGSGRFWMGRMRTLLRLKVSSLRFRAWWLGSVRALGLKLLSGRGK